MPTRSGKKYKNTQIIFQKRKRPMNPFFIWMNQFGRPYVKKQYPDLKPHEVSSFCGQFWRAMSKEAKQQNWIYIDRSRIIRR